MRLEWAHAQLFGQREGLAVGGFGLVGLRRLAMRRDLAEEPQGVSFVAPLLVGTGEFKGALCLGACLVQRGQPADTPRSAKPPGAHDRACDASP